MAVKRWADLVSKMEPARRAAIQKKTDAILLELDLRELRKLAGKTQADVAQSLGSGQGEVSLIERRDDLRVSTLQRYVAACGGDLEVWAKVGNRIIRLHLGRLTREVRDDRERAEPARAPMATRPERRHRARSARAK